MDSPLNTINTLELLTKIEEFKKLDLKKASFEEISLKSLDTLSCMLVSGCNFEKKEKLFRIRKLNEALTNQIKTFSDIWHPPASMVKTDGRVNLIGKPVLYCSTDIQTPLYECDIKVGDCYALIQYSIKENERLIGYLVGNQVEPDNLNETGKINNKIINDFVISEFTKPVGKGTEYLYKVSNIIAQNFMDMPFCDAYVYPSIANYKKGWNVAIKPESALKKINFDCVCICVLKEYSPEGGAIFELKHKASGIKNNQLVYQF